MEPPFPRPAPHAPQSLQARIRMAQEHARLPDATTNPWTAFLYPFRPAALVSVLMLTLLFSGQDLLSEFKGPVRAREGEPAPALSAERPGSVAWWSRQWSRLGADYLHAGPRGKPAAGEADYRPLTAALDFFWPKLRWEGPSAASFRCILLVYLAAVWMTVAYQAACGMDRFPPWPAPIYLVESVLQPAFNLVASLLASFWPALLAFAAPFWLPSQLSVLWTIAPLLLLAGGLYFPLALMCTVMRGRPSSSPRVVLPVYRRSWSRAISSQLLFLLLLAWPLVFAGHLAPHLPAWLGILAERWGAFTLTAAFCASLGLIFRSLEENLKWTHFTRA